MKKAFKLYEKIKKALWFINFGEFLQLQKSKTRDI